MPSNRSADSEARASLRDEGGADPSPVVLRELRLRFPPGRPVLDGVSFEARAGEILAIIGPSGCGKTSLLHIVMGLLEASSGEARVIDRKRIAMVFQKSQLLPWRSVVDNAAFGLECRGLGLAEARQRATTLLETMGLGDVLAARPHQLSEGMKQRVNLARALLVEPDLLLMDEPYAALDVMTRRKLHRELLDLWREQRFTVIFASHSLEEVVLLADRVLVLSDKPTSVKAMTEVDLPRPRRLAGEGAGPVHGQIAAIEAQLSVPPSGSSVG
jgi:ABC-type nitrate/sulfonate/bicarbonate transport system ATPase subunit